MLFPKSRKEPSVGPTWESQERLDVGVILRCSDEERKGTLQADGRRGVPGRACWTFRQRVGPLTVKSTHGYRLHTRLKTTRNTYQNFIRP